MKYYIKNMVCDRCIMVVKNELEKSGLEVESVILGEVVLSKELNSTQINEVSMLLESLGFSLLNDKKRRLIEQIKTLIINLIYQENNGIKTNLSDFLSQKLRLDYPYLSNLFSETEGITVEHYFIAQKIEKVKELLVYDELTLSEIAFKLNYSSVAHLSSQFKKTTGLTPSHFKKIKTEKRKSIDKL